MKLALLLSVLSVGASTCFAQVTTSVYDGVTPAGLAPGSPASSYPLLDFEHYDAFSGTLNPSVKLYHVGGRGNAGFDIVLNLQQMWRAKSEGFGTTPIIVVDPYPQNPVGSGADQIQIAGAVFARTGTSFISCGSNYKPGSTVTRIVFRMPNGTEVELNDNNTQGAVYNIPNACNSSASSYNGGRGTLFTSTDGSAITFVADSNVQEQINYEFGEADVTLSGYLTFPNGVTYRIDNSTVTYIRDPNGNKTTFTYSSSVRSDLTWYLQVPAASTITDSTGRVITINYSDSTCSPACVSINYPGYQNAARKILVYQNTLSHLLRDGGSVETFAQLFPTSNTIGGSNTFNPTLPSGVQFPDNFVYAFKYNVYGELTYADVAQGGTVEYDYSDGSNNTSGSGFEQNASTGAVMIYRRLEQRREYAGGVSNGVTSTTTHTASYASGIMADNEVVSNSSGTVTQVIHHMDGSPRDALNYTATSCNAWNEGFEYQTDYGISPVTRIVQNALTADSGCVKHPTIATIKTTNDANQVSQVTFLYDSYNNVRQKTEYAFGANAPGAALRTTVNVYLWQNTAGYAAPTLNIVRAPYSSFVYPGTSTSGTILSGTIWYYDAPGTLSDEPNMSTISGRDPNYTASGVTLRGNVTSLYKYLNTIGGSNPYVGYQMKYDSLGNLLSVTDPNSNLTTISYTDSFGSETTPLTYAYPTKTTNALNQSVSQTYDYYLGSPVSSVDPNNVVTTQAYWPDNSGSGNSYAADRPGLTIRDASGLQSQTQLTYPNPNVTITAGDQSSSARLSMVSYDIRDGFGRAQESDIGEGSNFWIVTCTQYDAMGNVSFVTQPFRNTGSPACVAGNVGTNPGTTYNRDALGRVLKTTLADGSIATTSYSGTTVTATDPAQIKKVNTFDVDGNLLSVSEAPTSFNYLTLYQYDLLDDLTLVCQGGSNVSISNNACVNGQQRSFTYDTLSRKLTAVNPESGTYTYTYDNANNLKTRLESGRNLTTTYSYDALNRPLTRVYSDGTTPNVTYTWDTAGNGVGQLYSIATAGTTHPVTLTFSSYDTLGNVLASFETIGNKTYQFGYGYDLASELIAEQYPSGRVVSTNYDLAGRTSAVNGQLFNTQTPYVSGVSYAPQGAPTQYSYANGVSRVLGYNVRLQPASAVDGTQLSGSGSGATIGNPLFSTTWNWNQATSGTPQNNGNLASDSYTHSGGGLSAALTFPHTYTYDQVSRIYSATEGSNWSRGFLYDNWGNSWVDSTRTSGIAPAGNTPTANVYSSTNNRINAGSYDNAGNQTSANGDTLTYDAESRVSVVTDGGGTESMLYDGFGNRVSKVVNGTLSTVYVYDAFGTLSAQYLSGAAATTQCLTCYISADQVGSTRLVTDQNAAVIARHDFLPFGEEITSTGSRTAQWGSTTDVVQKFTGQLRDTESGLDFFNARYYGSTLNRFTSPDPDNAGADTSFPQTLNGYPYVAGNPLTMTDPSGMFASANPSPFGWLWSYLYPHFFGTGGGGPGEVINQGGGAGLRMKQTKVAPHASQPAKSSTCVDATGSLGIGIGVGGNLDLGLGIVGASTTGGGNLGAFHNGDLLTSGYSAGASASGGATAYAGSHVSGVPGQSSSEVMSLGAYAGVGANIFATNASSAQQLKGPFTTWSLNVGFEQANIGIQYSSGGGIWSISITPPIFSFGAGASFSVIKTNTAATSTGCVGGSNASAGSAHF